MQTNGFSGFHSGNSGPTNSVAITIYNDHQSYFHGLFLSTHSIIYELFSLYFTALKEWRRASKLLLVLAHHLILNSFCMSNHIPPLLPPRRPAARPALRFAHNEFMTV